MTVASLPATTQPLPLRCGHCGTEYPALAQAICGECFGPLEPLYPHQAPRPGRAEIASRPPSLWRYREWLPFAGAPVHSLDTGFTPLVEAPALAAKLGVARCWIKNDTVSHPSLSFKDRVVACAINAAVGLGCETLACASTGNLANAVAAHAARAGLPAWILIPEDLEPGKILASAIHGARVVRIRGTYDDVNRLCVQLADRYAWGIANVNLRAYYGEGSKTVAFEIAEQLGWRLPTAVVAPMAGGSLVTKLAKGFRELVHDGLVADPGPKLFGAQAAGCSPIIDALGREDGRIVPVTPNTVARSLAIGSPADGPRAITAIRSSLGGGAAVSEAEIVDGVRVLAETTGIFTESAGGVTTAAALALAARKRLGPADEVVLCITAHGLKTPDLAGGGIAELPVVNPRLREIASLVEAA